MHIFRGTVRFTLVKQRNDRFRYDTLKVKKIMVRFDSTFVHMPSHMYYICFLENFEALFLDRLHIFEGKSL